MNKRVEIQKKEIDQIEEHIKKLEFKEALKVFESFEENNSFRIKYLKATALEGIGDFNGSLQISLELYKLNPENLNVILKIANNQNELKMYKEAVEYYKKVLFLDPFNREAKEIIENIENKKVVNTDTNPIKKVESVDLKDTSKGFVQFERIETGSEIKKNTEIEHKRNEDLSGEVTDPVNSDSLIDEDIDNEIQKPLIKEEINLQSETDIVGIKNVLEKEQEKEEFKASEKPESSGSKDLRNSGNNQKKEIFEDPEYGFITESAAKLYEEQELFDEAISIYEKLESLKNASGGYSQQIVRISKKKKYYKMINRLKEFKVELIKGVESV